MIQIKKFQLKNKNIEQSSDRIMKQTVRRIIHQMQKKKKKIEGKLENWNLWSVNRSKNGNLFALTCLYRRGSWLGCVRERERWTFRLALSYGVFSTHKVPTLEFEYFIFQFFLLLDRNYKITLPSTSNHSSRSLPSLRHDSPIIFFNSY